MASSADNAEITDGRISPTLLARAGTGGNNLPIVSYQVYDSRGNGNGDIVSTLTGDHQNRITDYTAIVVRRTADDDCTEYRERSASSVRDGADCTAAGLYARPAGRPD